RLSAALAVLAVILIGLSIVLRRDPEVVRDEIERMLLDEVDGLRDDFRDDVAAAVRATHRALGERLAAMQETVDALRAQVEYLRGQLDHGGTTRAGASLPGASLAGASLAGASLAGASLAGGSPAAAPPATSS